MFEVSHMCLVCPSPLLIFDNEVVKGSLETKCGVRPGSLKRLLSLVEDELIFSCQAP